MGATVMVTGGAGYIGSHVLVSLAEAGYQPVAVDDLSNGSRIAVDRAAALSGLAIPLEVADLTKEGTADAVMHRYACMGRPFAGVIHLAGRKAVGESVTSPLEYYDSNVCASVRLLRAMQTHHVRSLVFSSSATVYGHPDAVPVTEQAALRPTNPYGRTKLVIEDMLRDLSRADPGLGLAILRYFNPIGAHASGHIGECPLGEPANVFPYITQVAAGRRVHLSVFGNDYDTPDGTGVRDYLHVMDLAEGHVLALEHVLQARGCLTLNLGTGRGVSVLDLVHTFERVSGLRVPLNIAARRPGDIDAIWANPELAARSLGWKARRSLEQMCTDGWRWQQSNPQGYGVNGANAMAKSTEAPVRSAFKVAMAGDPK